MLSINTNLSSLIAQTSLKSSTQLLNQAVERMTTGYKINGAKDNAANYGIATNMSTKINAYQIAEENTAMGLDMLATANGTLDLIQDKLSRLRSLAVQSANGTYGNQSKEAINSEANALVAEIERIYNTSEYNGINLLNNNKGSAEPLEPPQAVYDGFIAKVEKRDTSNMKKLSEVTDTTVALDDGEYSISTAQELATLATMTNAGLISEGDSFVLAADIDLKDYQSGAGWTPIGISKTAMFTGTFDGNGHKITNLKINATANFAGLFGRASGTIKNVGVVDVDIYSTAGCVAGLVGYASTVENCYTTGKVETTNYTVGGLIGQLNGSSVDEAVKNCYSTCNIKAGKNTNEYSNASGLIGSTVAAFTGKIVNCYATGNITAEGNYTGGLIGRCQAGDILNCYATGNITAEGNYAGGLIGAINNGNIINCYATGDAIATINVGGLVGITWGGTIENSYATGDVFAETQSAGGLVGHVQTNNNKIDISNCYSTGNVRGKKGNGGFIGATFANENAKSIKISNCYSTGYVIINDGSGYNGGFIGALSCQPSIEINNCYTTGSITSISTTDYDSAGGFIGGISDSSYYSLEIIKISNCYATGNINAQGPEVDIGGFCAYIRNNTALEMDNCYYSGYVKGAGFRSAGLVGDITGNSNLTIKNSYMLGDFENLDAVLVCKRSYATGQINIENCYYRSDYDLNQTALFKDTDGNILSFDSVQACGREAPFTFKNSINIGIQIGTDSSESSRLDLETSFDLMYLSNMRAIGLGDFDFTANIDYLNSIISAKQVEYGAMQNRLESALDEIAIQYDNLVSSRSTIRDADIAEVSSHYIQQQILQQASATLLATANQSPSIALQLI